MNKLEGFDPNLYTDSQIAILIQKGYTPDIKKELKNKVVSSEIQNTNFIKNNKDTSPKISQMISKEHIDVQNKYAELKRQVEKVNDISAAKLNSYKKLEAENKYLVNLLKQNEQILSNVNKKLDYTLNSITDKTNTKYKKIKKCLPKPTLKCNNTSKVLLKKQC
jgi:hypothetical protein